MSELHPEDVKRLLARMSQEDVPDPGPDYWAAFPGRVRRCLAAGPPARTGGMLRWPAWGALAAGLLIVLVWLGLPGSPAGPAVRPGGDPGDATGSGSAGPDGSPGDTEAVDGPADDLTGGERVDEVLDRLLGAPDPLQVGGPLQDLSADEKLELLDILRRELDVLDRRGNGSGEPA